MCYQDMKVVRGQRDNALREAEQLRQERDALQAQLAAVTQQRDAAVRALEAVEFIYPYGFKAYGECPWCHMHDQHTPNCKRQAALALVRDA